LALFRQGDETPRDGVVLGVFFPYDNALHSIAFVTRTKTDRDAVWDDDSGRL